MNAYSKHLYVRNLHWFQLWKLKNLKVVVVENWNLSLLFVTILFSSFFELNCALRQNLYVSVDVDIFLYDVSLRIQFLFYVYFLFAVLFWPNNVVCGSVAWFQWAMSICCVFLDKIDLFSPRITTSSDAAVELADSLKLLSVFTPVIQFLSTLLTCDAFWGEIYLIILLRFRLTGFFSREYSRFLSWVLPRVVQVVEPLWIASVSFFTGHMSFLSPNR